MTSQKLIEHAYQLAIDIKADAILIYGDVASATNDIRRVIDKLPVKLIVVTRASDSFSTEEVPRVLRIAVPDVPMTRLGQIKVALLVGMARGVVSKVDRVVILTGIERSGLIDTIMVLDLKTESELISTSDPLIPENGVQPEVFERVLTIAAQIAFEGREGRQVGTIFVIGDSGEVLKNSENLVLNPFFGYSESQRNIMDVHLEETIKEFSTIDGAFVISGKGTIETAGTRLLATGLAPGLPADFPKGLGTRHAAAAAITSITKAIAISISQSTGSLTIFRAGHRIAEIPKPSPERLFV